MRPSKDTENHSSVCQGGLLANTTVGSVAKDKQRGQNVYLVWRLEGRAQWRRQWAMGLLVHATGIY